MLSYFKKIVKEYQSDIILTISIVLIALISFGVGRLTVSSNNKEPIIIQQPLTASVQECSINNPPLTETEQGSFVGSVNSVKYHWPDCPSAKKISLQNQVWFSSEQEAQAAGYSRCSNFEKYIKN
ncbi:MAG: hypothetical protein ABIC36_00600 [bacterium]